MHKGWYKDLDEDDENGFAQFGGYMQAKKAKLIQQVRKQATEKTEIVSDIFKSVAIFVNGHTKPTAEELKELMAKHGGTYHIYQMPSTTHIIASNLPNVKINKLGPLPIVKPNWIEDSITLGRLLDYSSYLLYTNQNRTQPQLNFNQLNQTDTETVNSKTKTASDPSFLSEFYGNSRLHLIATLGAEFKQYVNDLRANSMHKFPGLDAIKSDVKRDEFLEPAGDVVMHIDMDCFFVSVGMRNRPELKGKPVAVTHSKTGQGRSGVDRSVEIAMYKERLPQGATFRLQDIDDNSSLSEIASCSYEARAMGIKNGMFMGQALKLCPDLRAIPYDFNGYREVSKTLYSTISEYTLNIEAVSCDEMYVNITNILKQSKMTVDEFAAHIRDVIKQRTGCPCSTGFGSNRLQARLATKRAKPDGAYFLVPEEVESYFFDMPLSELPGVGRATLAKMNNLGLHTCGDVQHFDLSTLKKELGNKIGETIIDQAKGIDKKPLQYEHERKSVSAEVNYGIRFKTKQESLEFLERLAEEVTSRLIETGMKAKCVTLKLMVRAEDAPTETAKYLGHGVCDSMSRSASLTMATDDVKIINREAQSIFDKLQVPFNELRGVGVQLSRLEKGPKLNSMLKNFLAQPSTKKPILNASTTSDVKPEVILKETKKSPVKKRGRSSKNQTLVKPEDKSMNLTNYFKSTQKDRAAKKVPTPSETTSAAKQIDLAVLQELPEDIRQEIIKEYNLDSLSGKTGMSSRTSGSTKSTESDKPVTENSDKSNSPGSSKINNIEQEIKKPKEKQSGFGALSHEDFIAMLTNWLESEKPMEVDVEMLGKYFKELALQRKIEKLYIYIKFLHRNINEKEDLEWQNVYHRMSEELQQGMLQTYGKKLLIATDFST